MRIEVTWEVTEVHRMAVERDDENFNLESFTNEELDSEFLAEWEGDDTYSCTQDRRILYVGELAEVEQ